jgi:uncharacterized Fe-S cluster-containing protein
MENELPTKKIELPGLNCGACGFRHCDDLLAAAMADPDKLESCIHRHQPGVARIQNADASTHNWKDAMGREFDFILDSFDANDGPRETIHLFNGQMIKNLNLKKGDIIIGRPMAAGCPVTHCGKIMEIDERSGLIDWCVVGPLAVRGKPLLDIGSYGPVAFDGLIKEAKTEPKIGMRYYWLPRSCMLQWRHCGIIAALAKTENGYKTRIEGVFLG